MTSYEVPLTPNAQQFFITLGDTEYSLTVRWCAPSSCWNMDIADNAGTAILLNVPLVTGTDLLGQHKHLGFSGSLYVQCDGDLTRTPQYDELGVDGHLYFVIP